MSEPGYVRIYLLYHIYASYLIVGVCPAGSDGGRIANGTLPSLLPDANRVVLVGEVCGRRRDGRRRRGVIVASQDTLVSRKVLQTPRRTTQLHVRAIIMGYWMAEKLEFQYFFPRNKFPHL